MGEKIRDIHPIKIGKTSLMIELNEGYTPKDGKLIHIQNKKYRYLLKEKDFRHLCAMIMRSWSEFDYIKNKEVKQRPKDDFKDREKVENSTLTIAHTIADELEGNGVIYRMLDIQNNLLTVCVRNDQIGKFKKMILGKGGQEIPHPLGEKYGYVFLYLMTPFLLYKLDNVYVEVYCQLPCASLTPKNWIPLDKIIQNRLWEIGERKDNILWAEPICRYIFHLCWAIFHNKGFSSYERNYLSENKGILDVPEMRECLLMVFFNFTDILFEYIRKEAFDEIIPNYFHFKNY